MADKKRAAAEKKQAPRKRADSAPGGESGASGGAKRGRAGRLTVRRETAPYRAAAQEQATRVREAIEAALAEARRTRAEIEARIEKQWNNREPTARKRATARRRASRTKARA